MKTFFAALFLTLIIAAGLEPSSTKGIILMLSVAFIILAYLVYSLIKPEKF
jgi:K+-transporting ATPase KdpF subunit